MALRRRVGWDGRGCGVADVLGSGFDDGDLVVPPRGMSITDGPSRRRRRRVRVYGWRLGVVVVSVTGVRRRAAALVWVRCAADGVADA